MNLNLTNIEEYRRSKSACPQITVERWWSNGQTFQVKLMADGKVQCEKTIEAGWFFEWRLKRLKRKLLKQYEAIQEIQKS